MTVTPATLGRMAGAAAVAAGLIFIGVQINHPHLDATTIGTTNVEIRDNLKVLMAGLALVGVTGMYLRQVKQTGLLGLIGYTLLSVGYLLILGTSFVAAYVLPAIAGTAPAYVNDVTAAATGGTPIGDIGVLGTVIQLQGVAYLAGGLLFGVALYRARILARWATALLAVGGVVTLALSAMPDAFFRLLALPNGIAMIGLGCSLWTVSRARDAIATSTPGHAHVAPFSGE